MKKLLIGLMTAMSMFICGCDDELPTAEQTNNTGYAIGAAAATVANMTKITVEQRESVVEIITNVKTHVPAVDQTFNDVWTPVINELVEKRVSAGKLTEAQALVVKTISSYAVKALDHKFESEKYSKVKQYANLVESTVHGFADGFLKCFNVSAGSEKIDYDEDTYKYLMNLK